MGTDHQVTPSLPGAFICPPAAPIGDQHVLAVAGVLHPAPGLWAPLSALSAMVCGGLRPLAAPPSTCRWLGRAPQPLALASSGGRPVAAGAAAAAAHGLRSSSAARPRSSSSERRPARCLPQRVRGALAAAAASGSEHAGGAASAEAVVIVDHGSRKKESNDMLLEFVALYK